MRRRALLFTALFATVIVAAGCGSDPDIVGAGRPAPITAPPGTPAGPDLTGADFTDLTEGMEVEVKAVDNSFRDKFIEVKVGATITFDNRGRTAHNVLPVIEGAFPVIEASALEPASQASITLDRPGDYAYYCSLHGTESKGMVGVVRVVE